MNNPPPAINLIVQSGPSAGKTFAIQRHSQTIGRSANNDISIDEPSLSRQHARIRQTPNGFAIEDLGSTNGTFVNGQRISRPTLIRPGDTVRLGDAISFDVQPGGAGAGDQATMISDATYVPQTPPAPVQPPPAVYQPPPQQRSSLWIWIGVLAITLLLVGAIIGGLYYYLTVLSAPPTATPAPSTSVIKMADVEPTPTPTPIPTVTPAPTSEQIQVVVGGVAAAAAQEREAPQDIANMVDPFCNGEIEVQASEPVLISWQRRMAADDEIDYIAQWLESTYYDVRLDGRPITELGPLNYYRDETCDNSGLCGPTLHWWINVGLLEGGTHFLTLDWYTDREISNGLDVEPSDGEVDVFGPGLAGKGSCEISVAQAPAPVAQATPTSEPVSAPTTTPTPTPRPVATQAPAAPAPLGIFQDFETASTWKRGDQPYGSFDRSTGQVHSGSYAGQLSYNFPTADNDYVVFLNSRSLAGRPNAISAWVYGDGSSHFLNVWIEDAAGQTWQMSFGQIKHTGWQEMLAYLDPGQPWPASHISGPNNGAIDYPISFEALVLDDRSDSYSGSGVIYIDDLNSQEGAVPPASTPVTTGPVPQPQPAPSGGLYTLRIGGQHRYEEPWGAPKSGDPCDAWRNNNWDDENPNFRGFNVEILFTNNSTVKVQDDWGEQMKFFTNKGQEVTACYYGYAGAGPPPGAASSLTFFTVVPKGDFVQTVQLNLNGQFVQICLDGAGGWWPCQ